VILPKHHKVPAIATGGLETIGVRISDHPVAIELLRAVAVPLVAPLGQYLGPSKSNDLAGGHGRSRWPYPCILQGDPTRVGLESTVVDCTSPVPVVLRAGAVTFEDLRQIIPSVRIADQHHPDIPKSPGMKSSALLARCQSQTLSHSISNQPDRPISLHRSRPAAQSTGVCAGRHLL
jgi:L-threonylcarbamoyladenylate synthase